MGMGGRLWRCGEERGTLVIEARNLGKTYPDRTVALEGLNLRIVQGEFVILAPKKRAAIFYGFAISNEPQEHSSEIFASNILNVLLYSWLY